MKKSFVLAWIFVFLLTLLPISSASIRLIPSVDSPQDAVEAAVLIPEAGVGLAMIGYDQATGKASFAVVKNGEIQSYEARDNVRVGEDLKLIPDCMTAVIETASSGVTLAISCAHPYVVIVANPIDLNLSSDFVGYLEGKGAEVVKASLVDFDSYRDAQSIILLGGPDALEGIGNLTRQALTAEEQAFLRREGNRAMFVHENPWHPGTGRAVAVLAGSDRYQTQRSVLENQARFTV